MVSTKNTCVHTHSTQRATAGTKGKGRKLAGTPTLRQLGFDERFRRMWHYYLCYSEVGFDTGKIDVAQFTIQHR